VPKSRRPDRLVQDEKLPNYRDMAG
jgi:hypothetical protein